MIYSWHQSVVPFAMKWIALNSESIQFVVGNLDSRCVGIFIQRRLDPQTSVGRRAANQINHDLPAYQRACAPIGGDMTEHAMLNLVPFAGAWRKVANLNGQMQFVSQQLQLPAPQAHPI